MSTPLAIGVDSTTPRLAVDVAILGVVGAQVFLGWRYGLVRRAFVLAATFAATVGAVYAGNAFGGLIRPHDVDANALSFIGLFAGISLLFEAIGALASQHLRGALVVVFDRSAGALAGLLIGLLQVGVVVMAALSAAAADPASGSAGRPASWGAADAIRTATLGGVMVSLEPGVRTVLTPVLPASLQAHLASGPG